ncbi:MAG: Mur ligase, partial [Verrucomicrobia bacterium 21-51-4]
MFDLEYLTQGDKRALKIYFLGICGTAMGHVALLMRELGHTVIGADTDIYPPMSDLLRDAGVEILQGYDAQRLQTIAPDVVVIGNIASRGHPEVEWLLEQRAIPYISMPALLEHTVLRERCNVVITGTHGKTTTTALTAHILESIGQPAGFLIGGVPNAKSCGVQLGQASAPFVIEGDEYDTAFFDKRSKFIHYRPRIMVINNIEFDHADIFRDLEDIKRSFAHATRLVPASGAILANGDDAAVEDVVKHVGWTSVWRVGIDERCDLRIADFHEGPQGSQFVLVLKGKMWGLVRSPLGGLFNARNTAMAALA